MFAHAIEAQPPPRVASCPAVDTSGDLFAKHLTVFRSFIRAVSGELRVSDLSRFFTELLRSDC